MVTGGCACGAVRYEAAGACSNSMVGHCRSCRRAAGAPVVPWVTFAGSGFRFIQGEPGEFRSSAAVVRTFCRACGTPLTYRHEGYVDAIDITTCSPDEPGKFPPTHHSWLSHDLLWVRFGDDLPTYPEFRPGRQGAESSAP